MKTLHVTRQSEAALAREASGLGLSALKSVESSLTFPDGTDSTNAWKTREQTLRKMSLVPTVAI